jgi:hypothetical protein
MPAGAQFLWQAPPQIASIENTGTALVWTDDNLTLVFLQFPKDKVRIRVDATRHLGRLSEIHFGNVRPLAIVSGGTWSEKRNGVPVSEGLVVANGRLISDLKPTWQAGGIFAQMTNGAVVLSSSQPRLDGVTEAIQSRLLLARSGVFRMGWKDHNPADRVAIGVSDEAVIVAAAIHRHERTATLRGFVSFVHDIAMAQKLTNVSMINLDGACEAQLYVPSMNRLFSCSSGVAPTPNRVMIWSKDADPHQP